MRETPPQGDRHVRPQTRPFGSSGLAAALGIGVFLIAILIAGFLLVRGGDDNDNDTFGQVTESPTAAETETGSLLTTETPGPSRAATNQPSASLTPTPAGTPEATPRAFPTLTPAPTNTPAPDDEEEGEAEPDSTEPAEEPADPEPEDPDPTPPDDDPPTPVEEPVAGDFGYLPPPQLPSGGAGQDLSIDYQLATSLEMVPQTGTVYEIIWPSYTEDEVALMAANIGVDGEVESQGDGVFQVAGSEGSLFVAPTVIEYGVYAAGSGGPLPSSDVAIDAAWNWFSSLGIDGVSAGESDIVAVEESAGLSVVSITPSYPTPNLAPTPSARIKVSAEGVVEEATVVWPSALAESEYGLKPGIELWEELRSGNAFISADLSETGGGTASMSVTDISIAYTVAGSPWEGQYLVPLVVFGGTANVNGSDVYVTAYVPAVYHQGNPLG